MKNRILLKTFQTLETIVHSADPISLKELSVRLDINISTLSRITADLLEAGYITKYDYHTFEVGLGIVRLEQNAISNLRLTRLLNPLLGRRAELLGTHVALAGWDKDEVIYLFRTDFKESPTIMPYFCDFYYSNIGIAILSQKHTAKKALEIVCEKSQKTFTSQERDQLYKQICDLQRDKYYIKREFEENWNISIPFCYNKNWYGVALYGGEASRQNMDTLLCKALLLERDIRETLEY